MIFACGNTVLDTDRSLRAVTAVHLTPQEAKLAYALFSDYRVISKAELMDYLYDPLDPPYDKAVDVALCRLRKKLAVIGSDVLIHSHWGLGWHLLPPNDAPESGRQLVERDVAQQGHDPLGATEGNAEGVFVSGQDYHMINAPARGHVE